VAEISKQIEGDIFINIQADYPDISPENIQIVAEFLKDNPDVPMATLSQDFENRDDVFNAHHVKVYENAQGFAQNFSRENPPLDNKLKFGEHIGVYGFQRAALKEFADLPQSPREKRESLEQMRAFEHGMKIKVLAAAQRCYSINVPEDIPRFQKAGEGV
jgi:3-deoxy-manno-octulosonate cytidylyltransferase (CMP-KDO synthetase)